MPHLYQTGEILNIDRLERFANHVAQHEREECAKVCEEVSEGEGVYAWALAEAIRARGNT